MERLWKTLISSDNFRTFNNAKRLRLWAQPLLLWGLDERDYFTYTQ